MIQRGWFSNALAGCAAGAAVCLCFAMWVTTAWSAHRHPRVRLGPQAYALRYGWHGAVVYQCQGVTFPKRRLFARSGAELGRDPAARALRRYLRSERLDFEPRHGWKLLARRADVALYGARAPDDPPNHPVTLGLVVRRVQRGWGAVSSGDCTPERAVPALDVAQWALAPDSVASRGSRTLAIMVEPPDVCQDPILDFDHAEVAYSPRKVTLLVFMRKLPPHPGISCPAFLPFTHRDIRLPRPLGKRVVQDPSVYPPRNIANLRRYPKGREPAE